MKGKSAVVTGASRGIGAAIARELAAAGCRVLINFRCGEEAALRLRSEIVDGGGRAEVFCCDVSDAARVVEMADYTLKAFGGADILVNNAGIALSRQVQDITQEEWRRVLDVNLTGAFNCVQAFSGRMISRKSGCILNVASVWGEAGASMETAYSASKAALIGFTKALSRELGPSGIRVNALSPGFIDTDMNANLTAAERDAFLSEVPLGRAGTPEEVAKAALFLCSDAAAYVTGQVLSVNGGL